MGPDQRQVNGQAALWQVRQRLWCGVSQAQDDGHCLASGSYKGQTQSRLPVTTVGDAYSAVKNTDSTVSVSVHTH
jgi:hypothetical protein